MGRAPIKSNLQRKLCISKSSSLVATHPNESNLINDKTKTEVIQPSDNRNCQAAIMSDVKDITPDLDRLDSQLDNLEDALAPLLNNLNEKASQLPLLDKAKLFSLTAYSIESLLFCEFSHPAPGRMKTRPKCRVLTSYSVFEITRRRCPKSRRVY